MSEIAENVHRYFATTIGLITTKSKRGQNIMAAEWTMQVSYEPMLLAVLVHDSPTYWNMKETRVFGVNLASEDQVELVNISGGYSGTEVDKLAIPGIFRAYRARNTNVPMIRGCALNAECRVIKIQKMGDHIMVVGEVVGAKFDEKRFPLIYTRGNYRKLSRHKLPSGRQVVKVTPEQIVMFKKMSAGQFVFKAAAAMAMENGRILLQKRGSRWILPMVAVTRGANYKQSLQEHLDSIGPHASVGRIRSLKRMTIKSGKTELRANFVTFDCRIGPLISRDAAWFHSLPKKVLLRALFEKP